MGVWGGGGGGGGGRGWSKASYSVSPMISSSYTCLFHVTLLRPQFGAGGSHHEFMSPRHVALTALRVVNAR